MAINRTSKKMTLPKGMTITIGLAVALLTSILGIITCAAMLNSGKLTEESVWILSTVIWVAAAFFGTLTASILSEQNILSALLTGLVYFLLLIGAGLLFFESNLKTTVTSFLSILAGSVPVILIVLNKKSGNGRKKRYQFR